MSKTCVSVTQQNYSTTTMKHASLMQATSFEDCIFQKVLAKTPPYRYLRDLNLKSSSSWWHWFNIDIKLSISYLQAKENQWKCTLHNFSVFAN